MEQEHERQGVYVDLTRDEIRRSLQIADRENRKLREQLRQFVVEGIASREPQPVAA